MLTKSTIVNANGLYLFINNFETYNYTFSVFMHEQEFLRILNATSILSETRDSVVKVLEL